MNIQEKNHALLVSYFQQGCKSNCIQKLGVEIEHFIIRRDTKESVPYYGERGVAAILTELSGSYPEQILDNGALLGLANNDYSLTLEPAGQLEISIVPKESIRVIYKIYKSFLRQILPVLDRFGYELVTLGYHPKSRVRDLPLIPKLRYAYMDKYFQDSGTLGANMMRGTASTQISVDYCCEEDFILKYRAAFRLMPAIKLLTDNTPVFEGAPYPKHLARTHIWNNVDAPRCGIFPGVFDDGFGFFAYADYLMRLPLIFVPTSDGPLYTGKHTAAQIWSDREFTRQDILHILSMTFLDVRLKNYVEIRGGDSMPLEYVLAYLAFIKGLFFRRSVLREFNERFPVSEADIRESEASLMEHGWNGTIYKRSAPDFLREILSLAEEHLEEEERIYLLPFWRLAKDCKTLAKEYI